MTRQNFGGQRQQPLVGPGGIPLVSKEEMAKLQQEAREEQERRETWAAIEHVERLIYSGLVLKEIDLTKATFAELDPERFRQLAFIARQTAPFLAESKGKATLSIPGMEVVPTSDDPPAETDTDAENDVPEELGKTPDGDNLE